jgi:hypothetical protein
MTFDLVVDADAVRGCASALADTAAEIAAGATPPPSPPAPDWESTAAAESLGETLRHVLATAAGSVGIFEQAVLAAIADYRSADDRAADRLREIR